MLFTRLFQDPNDETEYRHWFRVEWPDIKAKVWRNAAVKGCWICGKTTDLRFHHLSYLRIDTVDEWKDIVIVCSTHHYLCHFTLFGKIEINSMKLTKRYKYLKKAKWRRFRPSDFFNAVMYAYGIGSNPRRKRESW